MPDAPAGDALAAAREEAVEYVAAQLAQELGLSFRPRETATKAVDFTLAFTRQAIEAAARSEGAAALHGLAYAADGHLLSRTELRFMEQAMRSPSSGTEVRE